MRNKVIFCIINLLLILLIALVIGIVFAEKIFDNGVSTAAFVLFNITMLIPSILYIFKNHITLSINTCSCTFMIIECLVDILFMCAPKLGIKTFAITQVIVIGLLLIVFLVIIFFFGEDEKENKEEKIN